MTRLAPLQRSGMNEEQGAVFDEIVAKGGRLGGPYEAYIRIPGFMRLNQQVGDYLRSNSLSPRVRLLAVLLVVRHWNAAFAWATNAREALAAGLGQDVVEAINRNARPPLHDATDQVVYELVTELLKQKRVSDETYRRAGERLDETALVDLVATVGFYGMVCTTLTCFAVEPPPNAEQKLLPT